MKARPTVLVTRTTAGDIRPLALIRCPCGSLTIATEGPLVDARTIFSACWHCGDEAIRYTDAKAIIRMAEWNAA